MLQSAPAGSAGALATPQSEWRATKLPGMQTDRQSTYDGLAGEFVAKAGLHGKLSGALRVHRRPPAAWFCARTYNEVRPAAAGHARNLRRRAFNMDKFAAIRAPQALSLIHI